MLKDKLGKAKAAYHEEFSNLSDQFIAMQLEVRDLKKQLGTDKTKMAELEGIIT